jgi:anti-anti-sigma factor
MTLADVQFEEAGQAVVAHLTGEIDLSNAPAIGRVINDELPNHALALVLDLSAVEYLESAGIQLIYELRERLGIRGQAMHLVVPAASVAADTLRLTGLDAQVDTFETVEAAISDPPSGAPRVS